MPGLHNIYKSNWYNIGMQQKPKQSHEYHHLTIVHDIMFQV